MCRRRRWHQPDKDSVEQVELPLIDMLATGQNIEQLRKKAGLTVKDLQEKLELASPQAIYKWQRGDTIPTIDNLIILADVFGVSIDDIIVRNRVAIERQVH